MFFRRVFGLALQAALCIAAHAQDTNTTLSTRILHGRLLGVDASPVTSETVLLLCATPNHGVSPDQAARHARYHSVTDGAGRFSFELGQFESPITEYSAWEKGDPCPGWGVYYLWVRPDARSAGALSPPIVNLGGHPAADFYGTSLQNPVKLEELKGDFVLRLDAGRLLNGVVETPDGHPVAGQSIAMNILLHAGTPNPNAIKFLIETQRTDAAGHFRFARLCPITMMLDTGPPPPYWIRTRPPGASGWILDRQATVDLRATTATQSIGIMLTRTEDFALSGTVRDNVGRPVAGARIVAMPVDMASSRPFMGAVRGVDLRSDAAGRYSARLPYP